MTWIAGGRSTTMPGARSTTSQRGISRALIVLALSGAGTGIVGAVSVSAHADGLPSPTPLPTTDPTSLLSGVTDPLPLPGATDSPSPAPDGSTPGGTTTPDGTAPAPSGTDSSTGPTDAGAATGSGASGATSGAAVSTSTKSTGHSTVTNTGTAKTAPVTSTKVSTPSNLSLTKTAGGLTQGATVPNVTAPRVSASVPMTMLLHGLSLPNLPPLPGVVGSSLSTSSTQAPIVAPQPITSTGIVAAGGVSAQPYSRASSSTPTGRKSPVAPALFALVAAAVAAGAAKVRIRWGRG